MVDFVMFYICIYVGCVCVCVCVSACRLMSRVEGRFCRASYVYLYYMHTCVCVLMCVYECVHSYLCVCAYAYTYILSLNSLMWGIGYKIGAQTFTF